LIPAGKEGAAEKSKNSKQRGRKFLWEIKRKEKKKKRDEGAKSSRIEKEKDLIVGVVTM